MSSTPSVLTGANIRAEMARQGITQTTLADALGMKQGWVSSRLRGRTPVDINDLTAIAEVLGVPLSALLPNHTSAA